MARFVDDRLLLSRHESNDLPGWLAVGSCNLVGILVVSFQAVRSIARVVLTSHANPALRATLSQYLTWSGPG